MGRAPHKVLVTGAGRCGTSAFMDFLLKLHGYDKVVCSTDLNSFWINGSGYWNDAINAGMEYVIDENSSSEDLAQAPYIIKDIRLCCSLKYILRKELITVDHLFLLIRDYRKSAKSRLENDILMLEWRNVRCVDERKSPLRNQIEWNQRVVGVLMETIATFDIPHTVIHFPTFVENREYLFSKLSNTPLSCERTDFDRAFSVFDTRKVHVK